MSSFWTVLTCDLLVHMCSNSILWLDTLLSYALLNLLFCWIRSILLVSRFLNSWFSSLILSACNCLSVHLIVGFPTIYDLKLQQACPCLFEGVSTKSGHIFLFPSFSWLKALKGLHIYIFNNYHVYFFFNKYHTFSKHNAVVIYNQKCIQLWL